MIVKGVTINNSVNDESWIDLDQTSHSYHSKQWEQVKFSTISFYDFMQDKFTDTHSVIDLGAGSGAPTAYFAEKKPFINFTAFDLSEELIEIGSNEARKKNISNLKFLQGDIFNIDVKDVYEGCLSLQTLSWLPRYEDAMLEIFTKIKPRWIGLTSLFYEGRISCKIEVTEHMRSKVQFYNVYSIPEFNNFCKKQGYKVTRFQPFKIEHDLPKPKNMDLMSTFTYRLSEENEFDAGKRLQVSGPLLMNWYMLLLEGVS